MGNVLDHPKSSGDTLTEDLKWLAVQNSSLFNDSYVAEVYDTLPEFTGTELPDDKKESESDLTKKDSVLIERLVQIFSSPQNGETTVENFERLSSENELASSPFALSNKRRSRLLQRIHLAMLRVSSKLDSKDESPDDRYIGIEDMDSFVDADGLLTATSIRMSLAIMECLAPSNPALFAAMSNSIMDLLQKSSSLALASIESSSPQAEGLRAIIAFAEATASQHSVNREAAIALMLAVAVNSGSLSGILSVVSQLKKGNERLADNAAPFRRTLQTTETVLNLSLPLPEAVSDNVEVKIQFEVPAGAEINESSLTTDGTHLYIWNGVKCSIHKVGTGFHGTIAGNEYLSNASIEQQIRERLGSRVFVEHEEASAATPSAPSSDRSSVEPGTRSIRVVRSTHHLIITEGVDIDEVLRGDAEPEGHVDVEEGFVANILEERTVMMSDFDREVRFFRIGDNVWIPEEFPTDEDLSGEDEEQEGDEDEEESTTTLFVQGCEVITATASPQGDIVLETEEAAAANTSKVENPVQQAWLAYANGKVYMRMKHLLGPFRIAVFTASALKLEDICDLNLPIPKLIKAKRVWERKLLERATADAMEEAEESKDDIVRYDEKESDSVDAMQIEVALDDDNEVEVEEYEAGPVVDLIRTVLVGNEAAPLPSLVAASSNFMASGGVQERNLLAGDGQFDENNHFHFSGGDPSQEIILDLGGEFIIHQVGAEFQSDGDTQVHERFAVHVSPDGNSYNEFNTTTSVSAGRVMLNSSATPSSESDDVTPVPVMNIRYIRFNFGACAPSGNGSSIKRLFVMGPSRVKKVISTPFPAMTSDGRHLIFLHATETPKLVKCDGDEDEESSEPMIQAFTIDPCLGFNSEFAVKDMAWGLSGGESELHRCSFLYNSAVLIVSHVKKFLAVGKDDKKTQFVFWKLDVHTGKLLSSTECTYEKTSSFSFPLVMCYDSRNNMSWGWNWHDTSCTVWRNNGLAPRFDPPKPKSHKGLLLSSSPYFRLDALNSIPDSEKNATHDAAVLLCHIDRLSLLYSPPREPAAGASKLNELEVIAAGVEDGNFCKLLVRGQSHGPCMRGFNLLVLDKHLCPKDFRNFDTHEAASASDRMADFIESIPANSVVMVGTLDTFKANLTSRGRSGLRNLGATSQIEKLNEKGSFAMIGRKGADSSDVIQQQSDRKHGPSSVRYKIPSPKVPLSIECSYTAIHALVELVCDHYLLFKENTASDMDVVMLITSMRILSTNVYQLLCGNPIDKAITIFDQSDRNRIIQVVSEIIDSPSGKSGYGVVSEAALQLFVNSIDVLYPTPAERCSLLVRYLEQFVEETLSDLEGSVLELLLRQMASPTALSKLFEHAEGSEVANPTQLLLSLLSIAKKETTLRLERLVDKPEMSAQVATSPSSAKRSNASVGDAAVKMLASLCNMILSQSAQAIISPHEGSDVAKPAETIISLITHISECSSSILHTAAAVNSTLFDRLTGADRVLTLDDEVDEIVKISPVGELLSTVLYAAANVFEAHGSKLTPYFNDELSKSLTRCQQSVQSVLSIIPKSKRHSASSGEGGARFATEVFESLHPYLANTNETFDLNFPKAVKMTITFSEETKTENNYDYVRFWKDSAGTESCHPGIDKLTGRNGSENWPGQGGRPPLEIEGGYAHVEWKTDGSNEDWGWKFNCVVEYKRVIAAQSHWLVDVEKQLGYCGSVAAISMIVSIPWDKEVEDRTAFWMEDSLLDFGFREEGELEAVDGDEKEELQFLHDFVDRAPGSLAATLCTIMKKHVREDVGQVDDINRAVYATCAALLKHNNVVNEAMALAKGVTNKPSDLLIKVWRAGQNMHKFFQFGDVRDASKTNTADDEMDMPPPPTLERGPSIYSGADIVVVRKTSDQVITRAQFLLRVNSTSKAAAVAKESAKRKWGLLSKTVINRGKTGNKDGGDKWKALVGEVQAAYELKDMLSYRRKEAALRKERVGGLTTSEKVLRFVQGRVLVSDLERIRNLRNNRAKVRSTGLSMISHLIASAVTPFAVRWLMSCFSHAIALTKRPDSVHSRVHYLNTIEGCSSEERGLVIKSFCSMVEKCVMLMAKTYGNCLMDDISEAEKRDWESVTISCLRALAIDYDVLDHSILDSSNLLSELQFFLESDRLEVQRTGWALYELLLPRCIGMDGPKGQTLEQPTDFSKKIVALLVSQLDRAASKVFEMGNDENMSSLDVVMGGTKIVPGTVTLRRDCLGYTMPHLPLGLNHTFSFWMLRKRSAMDDVMASGEIAEGHRVMRGPGWTKTNVEDGGSEHYGTVTKVTNDKVQVKWDNSNTGTYKFGTIEDGLPVYEISIVDEAISGHLFSKGMGALMNEETASVWSTFGVALRADATLKMFSYSGAGEFANSTSVSIIPPDEWTHVAVVQDKQNNHIYLNGQLDSTYVFSNEMLYEGKGSKDEIIVESDHPYPDSSDTYTTIREEGAISYSITFDPRSSTESNYDYIRFYKDSGHNERWGAEKYCGGRGGSSKNFPGMEGRPPLVIPADSFVIHFRSDNSNNDWGYKMTISVEKIKEVDPSKPMIKILNDKPIYIGQMPTYVHNIPSSPNAVDGSISRLSVFYQSLSAEQIVSLAANKPVMKSVAGDEVLCLDVLSIMHRSSNALRHVAVQLNSAFSGPSVLYPLLCIAMNGTAFVQCSALRVCASLLPVCPIEVVNVQAKKIANLGEMNFIEYLFARVGQVMNVWSRYTVDHIPEARMCTELEVSIGMALLSLLNALAVSELWGPSVLEVARKVVTENTGRVLSQLHNLREQETARGVSLDHVGVAEIDINMLYAILGLLGGSSKGLFTGATARYAAGDDNGIMEDCTVLASTWPPDVKDSTNKQEKDLWKDKTAFGDAFVIVLHSQPGKPIVVPRTKLKVTAAPFSKDMDNFLAQLSEPLVQMFTTLSAIDASDKRPVHKPRVIETDEVKEFESTHPYADNMDTYEEVTFPGAKKIEIEFDRRTRTEPNCDFIKFYKSETHTDYWGEEKYHGRDSNQCWPGLGGKPNLIIPADSFVIHFKSDSSNNDWGYKFTARAHCVVKTYPPSRPPLLHNTILGHLKLIGLTAFKTVLQEFSWMTIDAMSVIPTLLTAALAPMPKSKVGPISAKPLIFESKHPYDHNAQDYIPVRISGAKKLIVTFDEQTCSESGCDHMKIFKDDSHTETWGEAQYTGGKDGGSCNWPGIKGRPPLIIPASSFVIYWQTDSSVNTWGWKMYVSASKDDGADLPEMDGALSSYRAECCQMVIRDCPQRQVDPPGLDQFEVEPARVAVESDALVLDISSELLDISTTTTSEIVEGAPKTPLDIKKSNIEALNRAQNASYVRWPRDFKLNIADATEAVLRSEPRDDADSLLTLVADDVVTAKGEQGDWLQVTFNGNSNPTEGWVRRRSGDMQYVIPTLANQASAASAEDDGLITLPDEDAPSAAQGSSKHPMFDVDESTLASVYGKNDIQPTPVETLVACSDAIERTAADMCEIASICVAQDCVSRIISIWPEDIPFTMSSFGSAGRLLAYIRAAFIREMSDDASKATSSPALNALKNRILEVIRKEDKRDEEGGSAASGDPQLSDIVMNFAVKQLNDGLKVETGLSPTKAKVKTLESIHPYVDNMDEFYELSIPGAKKLRIVFDSKTSLEKGCDYVCIYKDRSKNQQFGPQYTGRAAGSDKIFAGLNSTPACIVPGDSCVVYLHSDGSNVDWGFQLTCYGIMEEPSEEERDRVKAAKSNSTSASPRLACWLLEFLAKEHVSGIYRNLYAPSTIATLRRYVEMMSADKKLFAINLLTSMIQEITKVPVSKEAIEEILLLKNVVVNMSTAQHREEMAISGGKTEEISQLLQGLVQAAIVLESAVASIKLDNQHKSLSPKKQKSRGLVFSESKGDEAPAVAAPAVGWIEAKLGSNLELADNNRTVRRKAFVLSGDFSSALASEGHQSGTHACHVKLNHFSSTGPSIGVAVSSIPVNTSIGTTGDSFSVGWYDQTLVVSGEASPIPFGPKFTIGDVITVTIDATNATISFNRNYAFVGLAVGPPGSGAVVERVLDGDFALHLAVSLGHAGDSVQILDSLPPPVAPVTSIASLEVSGNEMPSWFSPVREAVMLLRSASARELPASVYGNDFIPLCEQKSKVEIESSHPYNGESMRRVVTIPGAESLRVRFDVATHMGENDVIRIAGGADARRYEYVGMKGGFVATPIVPNTISVSDKVVRGPNWDWGDQDGGAGSYGVVTEVTTWKGKANAGVTVHWRDTDFTGLYRWDFEGMFDLLVIGQSEKSTKPLDLVGNTLEFEVIGSPDSKNAESCVDWAGALAFNGESAFLEFPPTGSFEMDGDLTVQMWIKVSSELAPTTDYLPLFSRQIELDGKMTQFGLQLGFVGEADVTKLVLHGINQEMGVAMHLVGGTVTSGQWHHVAATVSGGASAIFVDGVLVASSATMTGSRLGSLGAPLLVGKSDDGRYFKGNMFDIRVYSTGASVDAINAGKNTVPNSASEPGLVSHVGITESPVPDVIFDAAGSNDPVAAMNVRWDSSVEPNVLPANAFYGFKCTITPKFSLSTVMNAPQYQSILAELQNQYTVGTFRHDIALVRYLNQVSRGKKLSVDQLLTAKWSDLAPTQEELVTMPVLKELVMMRRADVLAEAAGGEEESKSNGQTPEESAGTNETSDSSSAAVPAAEPETATWSPVEARFKLLQLLNKALASTVSYIDLCTIDRPWSVASLLSACRGLIFEGTKKPIWEKAMAATNASSSQFELKLSRSRAAKFARTRQVDHEARWMVFSQAFRVMHVMPPSALRRTDKIYNTIFMGERAHDAGGPYRESYAMMAMELQSHSLPLLIRVPNSRDTLGVNREKWVLNPGSTTSLHMDMFSFLGKLMGIAVRSKEYLALDIAPIIWKLLVNETPTREDLEGIDKFQVMSLDKMRNIHLDGIDSSSFSYTFFETFTAISTDARTIELVPGGAEKEVTFENRDYYCDLVEQYRLHEFDRQAAAVRRGLAAMLPYRLLSLYTWDQLEELVCGRPTIDIALLKSVTEYSSCAATDSHIQLFWQAMEEFSNDERSMFIKFTWGRSRLPLTAEGFPQRFKLQSFNKTPADSYLPVAHTCFFSLELPRYSTLQIMKDKLLYAVYNCQAIDGDDTSVGMNAASMGWEE